MIGALWTGISGLASHQSALDNESHNIANVNTVGYKASRISFADQMYQDRIGKGSKILDAEKLYVQGNLKLTGVDYDMALSGDGFFTVLNTRSSGTAETLYTRAGNFRMGDNGTLQDAAGNEVQGWAMREIDSAEDVTSTNPNVDMFTNDYTKLLTSKVISHSNYIETITAKATDYSASAKADSSSVFEGAGAKSKSAKISDVEALVSDYSSWLSKLKDDPDGGSASSTSQISQINFKSFDKLDSADSPVDNGLISKEGDQIYVYIDGNKYSQNYVSTTASSDLNSDGNTDDTDDLIASRIATYKALADTLSEIPGLRAYMAAEPTATTNNDVLENENYTMSTSNEDMVKGIIQIESLIPGTTFTITEVGEVSGTNIVAGSYQTGTPAVEGTGIGALESSRDALARAITGKQQDVYSVSDLGLATDGSVTKDMTYGITIYDKELGKTIPVPGNSSTVPATAYDIFMNNVSSVDEIVDYINGTTPYSYVDETGVAQASSSFIFSDYITAKNVNGNLVLETLDNNYDVEFSGNMQSAPVFGGSESIVTEDTIDMSSATATNNYTYVYSLDGGTTTNTVTITSPADEDAIATAINAETGLSASFVSPNLVIMADGISNANFSATLTDTTASSVVTGVESEYTQATYSSNSVAEADGTNTYNFIYSLDGGTTTNTLTITNPADDNAIATAISGESGLTATINGSGQLVINALGITTANFSSSLQKAGPSLVPLDKNNDYSGRQGAGAEFIELVNTIDQTTTQSSLQLKLDTLNISDSAFGEFSVDATGLITMKQDGAEFAIGQVSIALFNNNRGLDPSGDNLLAATNDSGEPIYNLNNDKTAKIEGQTLELSTADLSESLVNLMVFQRAFEANAKSITTSDELLNTLINLKR